MIFLISNHFFPCYMPLISFYLVSSMKILTIDDNSMTHLELSVKYFWHLAIDKDQRRYNATIPTTQWMLEPKHHVVSTIILDNYSLIVNYIIFLLKINNNYYYNINMYMHNIFNQNIFLEYYTQKAILLFHKNYDLLNFDLILL